MAHDTEYLTISQDEANQVEEDGRRWLLANRKLSLVVDLDQTIIHAAVDPTIAEWQGDKDNPNYEAVKDVRSFQLVDEGPGGMRCCWYYIKLRPGLQRFLENISKFYELHIYTMGTRQYAKRIADIIDPERKIFGERILSRDESGSMNAKNLERLFPVDTRMVVIIDDRGDVWKWSPNLLRVTQFDFFVGIGDINSSFLPKKPELQPPLHPGLENDTLVDPAQPTVDTDQNRDHTTNGVAIDGITDIQTGTAALEHLIAMGGGDDPAIREQQSKEQEELISTQLEEKPLLKSQMEQDEKDEAEAASTDVSLNGEMQAHNATESDSSDSSDSSTSSSHKAKARHSILRNDDMELIFLEANLKAVHAAFFAEYDRKRMSGKGGRVAALAGKRKAPLPSGGEGERAQQTMADLMLVPDIKRVMPALKMRVLSGVTIVFSGVVPLGADVQSADLSTWAKTFGAKIVEKVSREVTHLIARRPGTAKVKQAVKRGIKVVTISWLIESMQQWQRLDERRYLLEGVGGNEHNDSSMNLDESADRINLTATDFLLSSSEGEADETTGLDTETEDEGPAKKKLKVDTSSMMNLGPQQSSGLANIAEEDDEAEVDVPVFDDASPVTITQDEWDDIDAELKEFMGSEAESESDSESVNSRLSVRGKKRKKGDRDATESEDDHDLAEAKKNAREGGSALKTVAKADSEKSSQGTRTPEITDEQILREQRKQEDRERQEEEDEEDSDDELARELERELEEADG